MYLLTSHLGTYHGNGKSHIHNTFSVNLQLDITNIRLKGVHNNYSNNLQLDITNIRLKGVHNNYSNNLHKLTLYIKY